MGLGRGEGEAMGGAEAIASCKERGKITALTRRGGHGGRAFLTLSAQLASAAIADAGRIQQTIRAMAFGPAFLRIERMIGGTK